MKISSATIFLMFLSCFLIGTALAQSDGAAKVIMTDQKGRYPLGPHLEILEDPSGRLTINQVSSPEMSRRFSPNTTSVPDFGVTRSAIWARFRVEDISNNIPYWLLEVKHAPLDHVDLFLPDTTGGYQSYASGLLVPDAEQDLPDNDYLFQIPAGLQADQPIYLRFATTNSMILPAVLLSPTAFYQEKNNEELLWGIYYGIMLVMAIYNFLLFLSLRDRDYLFLVLYIVAVFTQTAFLEGRVKDILPSELGIQYYYIQPVFSIPILPALLLFSTSFLKTREFAPRLYKISLGLFVIFGLLAIFTFIFDRYLVHIFVIVASLAGVIVVILCGLAAWRKHYQPARYFLVALLIPLLFGVGDPLSRLGIIPFVPFFYYTAHFGNALLVTILSLALADRIHFYQSQTEEAYEKVQQREKLISEYMDALPIGVAVYGMDFKPLRINQAALGIFKLINYNPQNQLEKSIQNFNIYARGMDVALPIEVLPVYQALAGESSQREDLEFEIDGERIPLEILAKPIYDSTGSVQYAIAAFQDISQRKEQETAVRVARELYQSVVEKEALMICRFTRDSTLTFVNRAYCDFFGAPRQDLLGTNVMATIYQPNLAEAESELAKIRPDNATRSIEIRMRDRNARLRWLRWTTQGFFDDFGNLIEYQATGADITEQKEIEEQLTNYRENLEILVAERTSEERRQRAIAESLQLSASVLTSDLNLDNVLAKILEQLPEVIQLDSTAIFLFQGDALVLSTTSDRSRQPSDLYILLTDDYYPLVKVFLDRTSLFFVDTQSDPGWSNWEPEASIRSWMGTPLQSGDEVIGVLSVSSAAPGLYDQTILPVLEAFANHAAIAIINARLYQEIHNAAVLEERNRLARDLHDAVTQTLFSASIITQALPLQWEQDEAGARANLRRLQQLTSGALAEMRILLLELRPDSLQQIPLTTLLKNLCEANQSTQNLQVNMQFKGSSENLSIDVKEIFYRVTQEAFNNISKHSKASQVDVLLDQTEVNVVLKIQDNGKGFDPDVVSPGHLGLQIMRERAAAIEAKLQVESRAGEGTRLILEWRRKP